MDLLYYDLLLSGLTYVVLTYLAFKLMRKHRSGKNGDDGGEPHDLVPKIDLPPGVTWPDEPIEKASIEEEVLC